MNDTLIHKGKRKKLVNLLRQKGISDEKVLDAIGNIPRHLFMETFLDNVAYNDTPQPIGAGQTISQPYTVAFQTELLQIAPDDKVLEVGTGSGYQTAVLIELKARVFTIERQKDLYLKTRLLLPKLGYHAQFFYGDGYKGKPTYGPFDKIIITAGAPFLPPDLLTQLKIGGIIVAPIGVDTQTMFTIKRIEEGKFEKKSYGSFRFVPLLKGLS